jgi:hypothetical protein
MPPAMPAKFKLLLGNISKAFTKADKTAAVCVTSTWAGDIGGPEYLNGYSTATPTNVRHVGFLSALFSSLSQVKS